MESASLAKSTLQYRKLLQKRELVKLDAWFNSTCLRKNLIPKYIEDKFIRKSKKNNFNPHNAWHSRHFIKSKQVLIRSEIKRHHIILVDIDLQLKKLLEFLILRLHPVELDEFLLDCNEMISFIKIRKLNKLNFKIKFLLDNKHKQKISNNNRTELVHTFHTQIINETNTVFSQKEQELLEKGLKFNPIYEPSVKQFEIFIAELDNILMNINDNTILNNITYNLNNYKKHKQLKHNNSYNKWITTLKSIKNKIKNSNLIVTKADKGNCITILEKTVYIDKVETFLNDDIFKKLKSNPTKSFTTKVKQTLKNCSELVNLHNGKYLIPMNTTTPILYGLPKIHKPNTPIRPVVSYVNSPTYLLSKWINNIFIKNFEYKSKHSVKNSQELMLKLKSLNLPSDGILISFDVTNLFTNIPVAETLNIIKNMLNDSIWDDRICHQFHLLLSTCLEQNFFIFNEVLYNQESGLAMGSPLSPTLAEVFMKSFEEKLFEKVGINVEKIEFWFRYVDDILCLWSGSMDELHSFHNTLNSLHPNMKFTLEIESDKNINFLDLNILKNNNNLKFAIYRKPTQTSDVINCFSNHSYQHKMAAFNSYVNRLLTFNLNSDEIIKETKILKQIASINNFPQCLIDKLIKKKKHKLLIQNSYAGVSIENTEPKVYRSLTFINEKLSYKIKNIIESNSNIIIAFKPLSNLKKELCQKVDRTNQLDRSGIYKLTCDSCNCIYIGQTGRSFRTRLKEHIQVLNKKTGHSTFAEHLLKEGHLFEPQNNFEILHFNHKGRTLDFLENLEISKNKLSNSSKLLNDQTNLRTSPLLNFLLK